MEHKISSIAIAASAAVGLFLGSAVLAEEAINAKTVAEHMDKSKYSSADIKTYLKGLKDRQITADGKVKDILSGKTGTRIVLTVHAGKTNDFVVDVFVDKADKFGKSDYLSCKGNYVKYNIFTVNGITLKDGSCSKKSQ